MKAIDEPFDAARPMTADSLRPVQGYFWSRDSKAILFVQDQGGNENFHVYAVDPAASFATHLGGRYQADMPPEIRQTLEELTVDVESVAVRAE